MPKQPKFKPGEKAPVSGQYPVVGPRGGKQGTEVTDPGDRHLWRFSGQKEAAFIRLSAPALR